MQQFVSKRLRGIVKNQLLWCSHIVWWNWFFFIPDQFLFVPYCNWSFLHKTFFMAWPFHHLTLTVIWTWP